jgi:hypothetical protein
LHYAECCGAVPEADTVVNGRNQIPLPKEIQKKGLADWAISESVNNRL